MAKKPKAKLMMGQEIDTSEKATKVDKPIDTNAEFAFVQVDES